MDDRYKGTARLAERPVLDRDDQGYIYRIPKPFELGVVFGSGAERILDATVGKSDEAFNNFASRSCR